MTLPTYKVEVAWASTPFAAVPTFTDNSTDVLLPAGVGITFGRPDQYSQTQPSTASFKLANKTGKYTPDNTSSTLYPNVLIGKAVRITANEGGASSARFYGFIDSITVNFSPNGAWSDVDITAVDLLSLLGRRRLPSDLIRQYVTVNGQPTDYWQFGDADGTTTPVNVGSGLSAGSTTKTVLTARTVAGANPGGVTFGTATGPGTDGLSAASVTNSYIYAGNTAADHGYKNYVKAVGFFNVETFDSANPPTLFDFRNDLGAFFTTTLNADGTVTVNFSSPTIGTTSASSTTSVSDGATHCITVRASGGPISGPTSTEVDIWIDGNLEGVGTLAVAGGWTVYPYRFAQSGDGVTASTGVLTVAQLAVFGDPALIPVDADVSNAGLNGFRGETSAARFTRIAGLYGITPTVTSNPGTTSMGGLSDVQGVSLLDLLQGVEDTENGVLYVSPAGALTLVGRPDLYNQTAALTLTTGMYEADLQFTVDTSQFANDVTATGSSGVPQEYTDATSITNYGTASVQVTLNTTKDSEALAYAQWRVGTGNPVTRSPQISVDLLTQQTAHAALLASWWAVTPGKLITVSGLPGSAPASSVTLQVQGWTETLTDVSYGATINTGPATAITNILQLNHATFGKLDSGNVLAY